MKSIEELIYEFYLGKCVPVRFNNGKVLKWVEYFDHECDYCLWAKDDSYGGIYKSVPVEQLDYLNI